MKCSVRAETDTLLPFVQEKMNKVPRADHLDKVATSLNTLRFRKYSRSTHASLFRRSRFHSCIADF